MTDKLHLHLPKPHFPKLHRPRLKLKRHHRHVHDDQDDAVGSLTAAAHPVRPEDEKDENGDEPMPAVQRMQAEADDLIALFNLPNGEVHCSSLSPHPCTSALIMHASDACQCPVPSQPPVAACTDVPCPLDSCPSPSSQVYIDGFDCGLQERYALMLGRLSVFAGHLGFHSESPFGYLKTLLIPWEVRRLSYSASAALWSSQHVYARMRMWRNILLRGLHWRRTHQR